MVVRILPLSGSGPCGLEHSGRTDGRNGSWERAGNGGTSRFFVFRGPDDGFGGVSEIAARKIGRRVGLDPGDVIEELEAELLHGEADGMNDVGSAGDPDPAVGF